MATMTAPSELPASEPLASESAITAFTVPSDAKFIFSWQTVVNFSSPTYATWRPPSDRWWIWNNASVRTEDTSSSVEHWSRTRDFDRLADEWIADTLILSSIQKIVLHPAYQRIIGMGAGVLPHILDRLRSEPNHWFWALRAITGEDPAANETTIEGASRVWLEWGVSRGYVHSR